ncbi:MAG: hypothetical protein ACO1TE_15335 [Prosthecobacter sp.]
MTTFASIPEVFVRITGTPQTGWQVADTSAADSTVLPFSFAITDDGGVHFLLCCSSHDHAFFADTWHETLAAAFTAAQETFGIDRSKWRQ